MPVVVASPPRVLRVGEPTHELALTSAMVRDAARLVRPGRGRVSYVLEEVDLSRGRPDVVIVVLSRNGFDRFGREGLRLPHPTAARVLDEELDERSWGVAPTYGRRLLRQLRELGWTHTRARRAADLVVDSLAVEAKMADWHRGIRQIASFRSEVHRSALLLPTHRTQRVRESSLSFYGAGLLSESSGRVKWERPAVVGQPTIASRLWLLESMLRAHKPLGSEPFGGLKNVHRFAVGPDASTIGRRQNHAAVRQGTEQGVSSVE